MTIVLWACPQSVGICIRQSAPPTFDCWTLAKHLLGRVRYRAHSISTVRSPGRCYSSGTGTLAIHKMNGAFDAPDNVSHNALQVLVRMCTSRKGHREEGTWRLKWCVDRLTRIAWSLFRPTSRLRAEARVSVRQTRDAERDPAAHPAATRAPRRDPGAGPPLPRAVGRRIQEGRCRASPRRRWSTCCCAGGPATCASSRTRCAAWWSAPSPRRADARRPVGGGLQHQAGVQNRSPIPTSR